MKRILIILFLSIFTMTAWAIQYPQRTITDTDGDRLAITSDGDVTSKITDGTDELAITSLGEMTVIENIPDTAVSSTFSVIASYQVWTLADTSKFVSVYNQDATNEVYVNYTYADVAGITTGSTVRLPAGFILDLVFETDVIGIRTDTSASETATGNVYVAY